MDNEYVMISKSELVDLRKLKDGIDTQKEESNSISKAIEMFKEESKAEREFLLRDLEEIKELNKTILNNLFEKTNHLEQKFDDVSKYIAELAGLMSSAVDSMGVVDNKEIYSKLENIDEFMKNLKVLISYVRPADLVLTEKNSNGINSI